MRLAELTASDKCKTQSGKFYRHNGTGLVDELGITPYPINYDEPCEILKEFPGIYERESFKLIRKPLITPRTSLVFQTESGFRVRVIIGEVAGRVQNTGDCQFQIPFRFKSTDPRIEYGQATFKHSSGKLIAALWDNARKEPKRLTITYRVDDPIRLEIDGWNELQTVKSE